MYRLNDVNILAYIKLSFNYADNIGIFQVYTVNIFEYQCNKKNLLVNRYNTVE